jgi:hypothetical protein
MGGGKEKKGENKDMGGGDIFILGGTATHAPAKYALLIFFIYSREIREGCYRIY